jgi:hypothetical protein
VRELDPNKDGFFWLTPDEFEALKTKHEAWLRRRSVHNLQVDDHVRVVCTIICTRQRLELAIRSPKANVSEGGMVVVAEIVALPDGNGEQGDVLVRVPQPPAAVPASPSTPPAKVLVTV